MRRLALLLLLNLTVLCVPALADWPPITAEDKGFVSVPGQAGAPAVILAREEVDNDVLHVHSLYVRMKILTEAGRKYADVELPFYSRRADITDISGRTVHSDGTIVPFDGKPFEQIVEKGPQQQGPRDDVYPFLLWRLAAFWITVTTGVTPTNLPSLLVGSFSGISINDKPASNSFLSNMTWFWNMARLEEA